MIPSTDQKLGEQSVCQSKWLAIELKSPLGAIDRHGDCNINTASDFVAQYTTRQEYRYAEALPGIERALLSPNGRILPLQLSPLDTDCSTDRNRASSPDELPSGAEPDQLALARLAQRLEQRHLVSTAEVRDVLRRAAALLCRTEMDHSGVVHHLIEIPFAIFTKQSIKLGVALWLGVINENPRMESRILIEIAQSWEATLHNRIGVFSDKLR